MENKWIEMYKEGSNVGLYKLTKCAERQATLAASTIWSYVTPLGDASSSGSIKMGQNLEA